MITLTDRVEFLKSVFGAISADRSYTNISVECPECLRKTGKKKLKLAIQTETFKWHCWVCGNKGHSLVQILRKYYPEHLFGYLKKFDSFKDFKENDDSLEESVLLPMDYTFLASNMYSQGKDIQKALRYLFERRKIEIRDLWYFKFGISNEEKFKNRVIIPSFDDSGKINFFSARRIDKVNFQKYNNCSNSRNKIIFNEININWKKPLVLVEGPFDLVKCPENTIPLLGSDLNDSSLLFYKILKNNTPIILALDYDMKYKTARFANKLSSYDIETKVVKWNTDKDPGDHTKEEMLNLIQSSVLWSKEEELIFKISSL